MLIRVTCSLVLFFNDSTHSFCSVVRLLSCSLANLLICSLIHLITCSLVNLLYSSLLSCNIFTWPAGLLDPQIDSKFGIPSREFQNKYMERWALKSKKFHDHVQSILNCPHRPHIPMWQYWSCFRPLIMCIVFKGCYLDEHIRSCWGKVWSRTLLPHYHRCCCARMKGLTPKVFKDGYLRGTCPIMLRNNVFYDCKTNLEIKRTPIKWILQVNDSQMWNIFKHTFLFPPQNI